MSQTKHQPITKTPAPLLPGFYSLQAVSDDPEVPDITSYRKRLENIDLFKKELVKKTLFSRFLLRHGADKWDVFGSDGKLEVAAVDAQDILKSAQYQTFDVDRDLLKADAERVVGGPLTEIACVESHAGASAADHSNMIVLCRVLVMEASDDDNQHLYLADSNRYGPCRVMSLFGRIDKLSTAAADKFIDRHCLLDLGWPLNKVHHEELLGHRLATFRLPYLTQIVTDANRTIGGGEDVDRIIRDNIAAIGSENREKLSRGLVRLMYQHLEFEGHGTPEVFGADALKASAADIVSIYNQIYNGRSPSNI